MAKEKENENQIALDETLKQIQKILARQLHIQLN